MDNQYLFKVFVNEDGKFGNPGSLILDEAHEIDENRRAEITAELSHDETAFVDELGSNQLSIYSAQGRVRFAGSVLVGVGWQLSIIKGQPVASLLTDVGNVAVWQEGEISWLRASLENNLGNWEYEQFPSPDAVNSLRIENTNGWNKMVWAWIDENKGLVRARTFASQMNIPEVQGNGSGAMNLAGKLHRSIEIQHGDGSVIFARPFENNAAELGGRVISSN